MDKAREIGLDQAAPSADMTIECEGTGIVLESAVCRIVIGDQTTDPGLTYANVAGGDITLNMTMPNIEAHSWEGPLCFLLEKKKRLHSR